MPRYRSVGPKSNVNVAPSFIKEYLTAEGTVAAEPIPCSALITLRAIELGAKPHPMDHTMNQNEPIRNTFLRPKRSASRPKSSKKQPWRSR